MCSSAVFGTSSVCDQQRGWEPCLSRGAVRFLVLQLEPLLFFVRSLTCAAVATLFAALYRLFSPMSSLKDGGKRGRVPRFFSVTCSPRRVYRRGPPARST